MSDFLDTFESWISEDSQTLCCLTINQLRYIYYLFSNFIDPSLNQSADSSRIRNILVSRPFIFLPSESTRIDSNEKPISGRFYKPADVFWNDPTSLFGKYANTDLVNVPRLLEPMFACESKIEHVKQLFVNEFGVASSPSLSDYVDLLDHICLLSEIDKSPFDYDETLKDVYIIYETLAKKCIEFSDDSLRAGTFTIIIYFIYFQ